MMISQKMNDKLNEQITHEFFASQSYLAMACKFENLGLVALSGYFRKQAEEERGHGLKILDYLSDVGGSVALQKLDAPRAEYDSVTDAIAASLEHEKQVTQQIDGLVELAQSEKDHATFSFLQWFVDEQVEEVSSMDRLLQAAKLAGPNLLHLDAYVRHTGHPEAK